MNIANHDNTEKLINKGMDEIKKSGKDWFKYVETHPLQSMLFGLVLFFAAKGLVKE